MVVSELIKALQKVPQDAEVWLFTDVETATGEPLGGVEMGFVTELRHEESEGTLWPDLFAYDDIEEQKKKVIVLS